MIPFPIDEECVPPLKHERRSAIERLHHSTLDVLVCGASPLARELVRLAAHNSVAVGYVCRNDFFETQREPFSRRILSEILSARYDGALDINHVEILAIEHQPSHAVKIACRCRISGQAFEITAGAVINETGSALARINSSPRTKRQPWLHRLIAEQSGVVRFSAGRLQSKSLIRHAEFILQKLFTQTGNQSTVVPLNALPLIDAEFLSGESGKKSSYAIERINSFISECAAKGVPLSVAYRAIERFGTRVSHIVSLPHWYEQIDPEFLRGELHLVIATELPRDITEVLQRRLGIGSPDRHNSLRSVVIQSEQSSRPIDVTSKSINAQNLRSEHDLSKLSALFEQLQHFNSL